MLENSQPIKGRGAAGNPANRFAKLSYEPDPEEIPDEPDRPQTEFFADQSQSVITFNQSPDVPFDASINPYRGCEHGCIYCYARPTHEYLGFSAGLDFETRILVKQDAPDLLRHELSAPSWKPQVIAISGVTDPYQPIERKMKITRGCLEVLHEFRNPCALITKNHLITRDLDLLAEMAQDHTAGAFLTITSLDPELSRTMEPRTSIPAQRLEAIEALENAGLPVGVMVAPVIPGLNDHEIPNIIQAAAAAGAGYAGYVILRLPHGVADLFTEWLQQHYPLQAKKVLNRLSEIRGGKLNETAFGHRMKGQGVYAREIDGLFQVACRKAGLISDHAFRLSTEAFHRPPDRQMDLFE